MAKMRASETHRALESALTTAGIAWKSEVSLPARSPRSRKSTFRADVVVFREDAPAVAIECKGYSGAPRGKRQRENYAACGLPVRWCGPDDIDALVAEFRAA